MKILGWLEDNTGCMLPCWWGITPGKSNWNEEEPFIKSIFSEIWYGEEHGYSGVYEVEYTLANYDELGIIYFQTEGNIISHIFVTKTGTEISYQLNQLLAEYGSPEEVWIQGWLYNDDRIPHYAILVMYPSKGIMARYQGDAILAPDFEMLLCPGTQGAELNLWDPGREDAKEFAQSLIEQQNHRWLAPPFISLEEATGIDLEDFYEEMLDPEGCILTPQKIWDDQE